MQKPAKMIKVKQVIIIFLWHPNDVAQFSSEVKHNKQRQSIYNKIWRQDLN